MVRKKLLTLVAPEKMITKNYLRFYAALQTIRRRLDNNKAALTLLVREQ